MIQGLEFDGHKLTGQDLYEQAVHFEHGRVGFGRGMGGAKAQHYLLVENIPFAGLVESYCRD